MHASQAHFMRLLSFFHCVGKENIFGLPAILLYYGFREFGAFVFSFVDLGARWFPEHPDFEALKLWKTRNKSVYKAECPRELYSGSVVIKSYYEQRFLRYFLRPSLACREAEGYLTVQKLGIPTAEVLAYGERRTVWWLSSSFLITRFVDGSRNGTYFCTVDDGPGYGTPDMMVFCLKLIEMLATLHRNGYCHGGTHPRNFLWYGAGEDMKIISRT